MYEISLLLFAAISKESVKICPKVAFTWQSFSKAHQLLLSSDLQDAGELKRNLFTYRKRTLPEDCFGGCQIRVTSSFSSFSE